MKDKTCMYCKDFFDCEGKPEGVDRCLKFSLNPARAEDYREYVNYQVTNYRLGKGKR